MNARVITTVLRKEIRETLRDRRTLMVMLLVPVFLYPGMFVLMEQLALFGQRQLRATPPAVAVAGVPAELLPILREDTALRVVPVPEDTLAAIREGAVEAVVVFAPPAEEMGTGQATVLYDGSRDRSQRARDLLLERLDVVADSALARRLRSEGLPPEFGRPLEVSGRSVATAERMGGYTLGRFLPMILILMTVLGAFYPAIDLSAGEKERGTLEPLLTAPVPARELVAGKFLAVTLMALAAAGLNLLSMLLTFQAGIFRFGESLGLEFSLPLGSVLVLLLSLFLLAVLFAALFLGVAVRAQSFKEAQNALTPVYVGSFLPVLIAALPGIEFTAALALIPVGGVALLFRSLLSGDATLLPSVIAVASTLAYAVAALAFASRAFGREDVLFGSGSGSAEAPALWDRVRGWRRGERGVPGPAEAVLFVAVVALLFFYVGRGVQVSLGERGVLVGQWLFLAAPALLLAAAGPYDLRRTLALRRPARRSLAAVPLLVLGAVPIGWAIGWLQARFLDLPEELLAALERLLTAGDPGRLVWLLFLVALTPAVCEELVFRGVLLQGLGRELPRWRAVLLSAAIFGAFHLSVESAIRFLPSFWLGLVIASVAWQSRSIFPGMLFHFLNNAASVALVSFPALQPYLFSGSGLEVQPRWWLVALAPLALAAGVRLLPRREPEPVPGRPADRARPRHAIDAHSEERP